MIRNNLSIRVFIVAMSQVYGITIQKYNNLWSLKHKKSRQLQKQTAKIKIYKT